MKFEEEIKEASSSSSSDYDEYEFDCTQKQKVNKAMSALRRLSTYHAMTPKTFLTDSETFVSNP